MKNVNLGSAKNPIILKNKHQDIESEKYYARHKNGEMYIHRPLLQMHTINNHELDKNDPESGTFAFHKLRDDQDCFTKNVISNPHLQPLEAKILLALNEFFQAHWSYEMVYICSSNIINLDNFGDDEGFWIAEGSTESLVEVNDVPLYKLLGKSLNTSISNEKLNKILIRLDSFHYISVTPVTFENSKLGISKKHNKNQRAYLKIIQINELMDSKNLENTWLIKS
ncbi:hypothetical protein NQT69_12120 [Pseudoalteromonas shioyasakiensis]|uniref:hypothetical protein n=1 Tax=Pseudoalteromonas shioyasakiensis TaxID=1190813 RepID=UPI00211762E0|nr:hypothetical protein [Pseudoalteromonas shioyasakiensis]MCQ8878748.1 hypothetical protein [Pseudoalteromonas shioyasakiensis]